MYHIYVEVIASVNDSVEEAAFRIIDNYQISEFDISFFLYHLSDFLFLMEDDIRFLSDLWHDLVHFDFLLIFLCLQLLEMPRFSLHSSLITAILSFLKDFHDRLDETLLLGKLHLRLLFF